MSIISNIIIRCIISMIIITLFPLIYCFVRQKIYNVSFNVSQTGLTVAAILVYIEYTFSSNMGSQNWAILWILLDFLVFGIMNIILKRFAINSKEANNHYIVVSENFLMTKLTLPLIVNMFFALINIGLIFSTDYQNEIYNLLRQNEIYNLTVLQYIESVTIPALNQQYSFAYILSLTTNMILLCICIGWFLQSKNIMNKTTVAFFYCILSLILHYNNLFTQGLCSLSMVIISTVLLTVSMMLWWWTYEYKTTNKIRKT